MWTTVLQCHFNKTFQYEFATAIVAAYIVATAIVAADIVATAIVAADIVPTAIVAADIVATAIVAADILVRLTLNMPGFDGVGLSADDYFL